MYHYVYRITNTLLNKHYYGKRSSKLPPAQDLGFKYFSSSTDKAFKQDQKDNPQNYRYKVIKILPTAQEAVLFEMRLHIRFQVHKNSNFYNRAVQTGNGFDTTGKHTPHSEATKRKLSVVHKGRIFSAEHKEKLSKAKLGKKLSDTHKAKIAAGNTGRVVSIETIQKVRAHHIKLANIYDANTHKLVAASVCISDWCKINPQYSRAHLANTALAEKHKAQGLYARHQHKGIYARYLQQPKENT